MSKTVILPYGSRELTVEVPDSAAVLRSGIDELKSTRPGAETVREAMEDPVGSPRLRDLARGKRTATLIISDHTRPVPSKDIVPHMLRELREGSPDIDITLLVATGCHRGTEVSELVSKLGEEIVENEKIVVHDARDPESNVQIGALPSGAPLVIDRLAAETDLLVAEGFIEPHFFAGFSGGRKSVLPGICDQVTVFGNHCSSFIDSPYARAGILDGNPIQTDMIAAGRMAGLKFIVNVVVDGDHNTVAAFAGDFDKAHRAGCDFLLSKCKVDRVPADIIITTNGGSPLDQNIYQCTKGLCTAEATAGDGAVIIICAECIDGHGGEDFYHFLRDCSSPAALYSQFMATPQDQTPQDQWQAQIQARIQDAHTVIFVTRPELRHMIEDMKMIYAATPDEAFAMAKEIRGDDASVTVIPDGVSVIISAGPTC